MPWRSSTLHRRRHERSITGKDGHTFQVSQFDLVVVQWEDACGLKDDWRSVKDACNQGLVKILSVGWLLEVNEDCITLCRR